MLTAFKTPQEQFWAGTFGDEYTQRNAKDFLIANNIVFFSNILKRTHNVQSVMEFGANTGLTIRGLQNIIPHADFSALEINQEALNELVKVPKLQVYSGSLLDFIVDRQRDFVFTKAVLSHIAPEHLPSAYNIIYNTADRYICLSEFYNPTPTSVVYRGHENRLFKRDFAGEMLDIYKNLKLIDYGFTYHRDPNFPQGDYHWFLMEKCGE